jgi:hypothetical protein
MERRDELLKLKLDMVYRGVNRETAEARFTQIVSVQTPVVTSATTK